MCIWEADYDYIEDSVVKSMTKSFQFECFYVHNAWNIALEKAIQYVNDHPDVVLTQLRMIAI